MFDAFLQVGKNYANKRPTSYKTALMTMTNTATTRRRSRSRSPPRDHHTQRRCLRPRPRRAARTCLMLSRRRSPSPPRQEQASRKGQSAEAVARMEALKHKYG